MRRPLATLAAMLLLAGCGGDGRREALDTAGKWFDAVYARDAKGACELMAPSAVAAVRQRFTALGPKAPCAVVVEQYAARLPDATREAIHKGGLESEGAVKKDEIGIFPKAKGHQLDVVLMRRRGGVWKVVSTRIG